MFIGTFLLTINEFLNGLDGVMLLLVVLEVYINTFPFLKDATTEICLIIVMVPLILFSMIIMKKLFYFCLMKWHHCHYDPVNDSIDDERVSDVVIRYVNNY